MYGLEVIKEAVEIEKQDAEQEKIRMTVMDFLETKRSNSSSHNAGR